MMRRCQLNPPHQQEDQFYCVEQSGVTLLFGGSDSTMGLMHQMVSCVGNRRTSHVAWCWLMLKVVSELSGGHWEAQVPTE